MENVEEPIKLGVKFYHWNGKVFLRSDYDLPVLMKAYYECEELLKKISEINPEMGKQYAENKVQIVKELNFDFVVMEKILTDELKLLKEYQKIE